MMNNKWKPHCITVVGLLVLGFLGLACGSKPPPAQPAQQAFDKGDVLWLVASGEYDKVLVLLQTNQYKDLDSRESGTYGEKQYGGQTALMYAASNGKPDVVKALVEKGADIDAKTPYGRTPLMFASDAGKIDVVKLLVEKGAKVNLRMTDGPNKGKTAAAFAYDKGEIEIYNYLKEHGAIDFEPIQSQAAPSSGGQASSSSQSSSRTVSVTVYYELNGMRLPQIYTVTASSAREAEEQAQRLWQNAFGFNASATFISSTAAWY